MMNLEWKTVQHPLIIAGQQTRTSAQMSVINPATGEVVGYCPDLDSDSLDAAITAARAGFHVWKKTDLETRRTALRAMAQRIADHTDAIAAVLTAEQGKPLSAAVAEVSGTADWITALADQELPVEILQDDENMRVERHRFPLGVVAAIAPWNFPIKLGYWKVAPALLMGNSVILKPSPFTPLSTLMIGQLVHDLFPAGVFTTVSGQDALGPWITEHSGVDKVSFTGSSETGSKVMGSASGTLKRITLELGGNDAAIVLADANLDEVVGKVFWAALRNSGQVCIAAKRIFVHNDIFNEFFKRFVDLADQVRVGDGMVDGVELGPIQNRLQYDKVNDLLDDCRAQGYKLHQVALDQSASNQGLFVPISIVENPPVDSRIVLEEPFGPIVPILRFDSIEDMIEVVNASEYGLGGSVWTSDLEKGAEIALRVESGLVWVNTAQIITPVTPFGGIKRSGIGTEAGLEGLAEYTIGKTIVIQK